MNSSSEPLPPSGAPHLPLLADVGLCPTAPNASQSASYLPLQYHDAAEPFSPFQSPVESPGQSSAHKAERPGSPCGGNQAGEGDPDALVAAHIEAECRAIRAEARQEAEREIQRARSAIAEAIEQFASQREEYFRHAEEEVVGLALAIVRRLIHRESQIDPRLLSGLVNYELEQLDAATSVRLFVSPDALSYWKEASQSMSRPVEVAADKALAPGDARIETVLGSAIVSFERELKEIERGFFDLLSHRPSPAGTKAVRVQ